MPHVDNKRIAKNTLLLYGRMLLTMGISLYISRVVLAALGVNDYGIYNVVGGFVAMFSVISGSLSAGISRFITYELGRGNHERLTRIFSTSLVTQFLLAAAIILIAETAGLWFLNAKMNIAPQRMTAANWVYQCSIVTFAVNLISVPYNATIIAHEKMSAFAYISIIEVTLKLVVALVVHALANNRLIAYALLLVATSLIIRFIYAFYCRRHFSESDGKLHFDKSIFKEIASFSGWNFIGATSGVLRDQGVNILLNIFCGTAVNAARGIAMQVTAAMQSLATNFLTAVNPQITKSYAQGENDQMFGLAFRSSKFAFFIMFMLGLPLLFYTPEVLNLWLKTVPAHTVIFTRLSIVYVLFEIISYPLVTIMLAVGDIRNYQLIVGGMQLLNFPLSYLSLKLGFPPQSTYYICIAICGMCLIGRLIMLHSMCGLDILRFVKSALTPVLLVAAASSACAGLFDMLPIHGNLYTMAAVAADIALALFFAYYLGCDSHERSIIAKRVHSFAKRK